MQGSSRVVLAPSQHAEWLPRQRGGVLDIFRRLDESGYHCRWARCYVYCATESVLEVEPLGRFLLAATRSEGLELVADAQRGMTHALRDRLQRQGGGKLEFAQVRAATGPFHWKTYLFAFAKDRAGRNEVRLALIGSGNLSRGGFVANHELFVVRREDRHRAPVDWPYSPQWRRTRDFQGWPGLNDELEDVARLAEAVDWSRMPATAAEAASLDAPPWPTPFLDAAVDPLEPERRAREPGPVSSSDDDEGADADEDTLFVQVLEVLTTDRLGRLCRKLGERTGGSKEQRIRRIERALDGSALRLLELLTSADLRDALERCHVDGAGGTYRLVGVSTALLEERRCAARRVFVDGWRPEFDGAGVVPRGSIVARLEHDEVEDAFDDDDDDDGGVFGGGDGAYLAALAEDGDEDGDPEVGEGETPSTGSFQEWEVIDPGASDTDGIELAEFQVEAVRRLRAHFGKFGRDAGVLCLPTGGGKTRTALHFLLTQYVAQGERVLWIAPRLELLNQTHRTIRAMAYLLRGRRGPFSVSRYEGQFKNAAGDIVLVSSPTLARGGIAKRDLKPDARPIGIVCFDEAHRAGARLTARQLASLRRRIGAGAQLPLLALTATPFRASVEDTENLRDAIGDDVYSTTFDALIREGFLARPIVHVQTLQATSTNLDLIISDDEVAEARKKKELPSSVLARLARHPARNREIVELWYRQRDLFEKTIVFACTIRHANDLCRLFSERGICALVVHSKLDVREVRDRIAAFRAQHETGVIVNVGILTEGVDIPDARTVLLARPTMSPVLYRQMIGRAARGPRACEGKTEFHIVDCLDNFERFGLPMAGRAVLAELAAAAEASPLGTPTRPATREEADAATDAVAWLLSRGLEPASYRFWGTLAWRAVDGSTDAVAVFDETLALLRDEALPALHDCLSGRSERWAAVREMGEYLEKRGVLRGARWISMVDAVEATGEAPALEAVSVDLAAAVDGNTARSLARVYAQVEGAGVEQTLAEKDRSVIAAPGVMEPIVELGMHMAAADGEIAPTEIDALRDAARAMAASDASNIAQSIEGAILRGAVDLPSVQELATSIRSQLSLDRRLRTLDLAFAVANADGRTAPEEIALMMRIADLLDIPERLVAQRFEWYARDAPALGDHAPGSYVACLSCGTAYLHGQGRFCGACGAELP